MNKRGQVVFIALMLGILVFVLAYAFAPGLTSTVNNVMNHTFQGELQLDCDNSSINEFQKGSCLLVDLTPPYFTGILLGLVGLIILAKIVL
jgi:hypothetical protein